MEITQTYFNIIAIIAMILGIINIIFNIILFLRLRADETHEIQRIIKARLQSGECSMIINDMIKQELNNITHTIRHAPDQNVAKSCGPDHEDQENQHTSEENTWESTSSDSTIVTPINTETEQSIPKPITLYAGTYRGGSFKGVYPVPDEKTVYSIRIESEDAAEGTISIDPNAYAKVAATPDYLDDACNLHGNGSNVKQVNSGTVIKEDKQWVVKEKIEVELY